MKLAIVGSRNIVDSGMCHKAWKRLHKEEYESVTHIITGDCTGIDAQARNMARSLDWAELIVHEADWDKYPKAAGPIRNQKIIDDADMLIVIWDGKSRGSKDTILKAVKKGIPIIIEVSK